MTNSPMSPVLRARRIALRAAATVLLGAALERP